MAITVYEFASVSADVTSSSAISLSDIGFSDIALGFSDKIQITTFSDNVIYRYDGSNTSTPNGGHLLKQDETLELFGSENSKKLTLIAENTTATLYITAYSSSVGFIQNINLARASHDGVSPVINTQINGTAGTWTGSPEITRQWYKNLVASTVGGTAISGATNLNYTPVDADFGYYLYFAEIPNGDTGAQVFSNVSGFCQITGLALWLDASDAATLFQASDGTTPATANDDPVGYWGDKSGNGRRRFYKRNGRRQSGGGGTKGIG